MTPETNGRVVNGRYRLLSVIGSGGMGNVWLAEDEVLGRRVALKELVLSPNGEPLSVRRQRVLREARAAARIRHPGIVEVYDVFVEDDLSWIVMAHVKGHSLQDLIEQGPLDERRIAEIGGRVLAALTAAHRVDVLHRDVKPANILLGEENEVFLVDFGIAHIVGESRLTSQNAFAGTLEYMAPERINGLPPGPPADLWSLGATLFHALEGHSPFFRGSVPATMKAITFDAPPPLTRTGPLSDAIVRLLRKAPERRMDAWELREVLRSIVATPRSHPVQHRSRSAPASPSPGFAPSPPPHRREATPASPPPHHRQASPASPPPDLTPSPPSPRHEANPSPPSPHLTRSPSRRPVPGVADRTPERSVDLGGMDPAETARVLGAMAASPAARLLARLPTESAQRVLIRMEPDVAAAILRELSAVRAASILDAAPARTGGAVLNVMAAKPQEAAAMLRAMGTTRAGQALSHIDPGRGGALLGAVPPGEAAKILACTDTRTTAGIVRALSASPLAIRLIETMPVKRACGVLGYLPPAVIAGLLGSSSDGRADRLLNGLDDAVRAQVLRHMRPPREQRPRAGGARPENPGGGRR
ncbi:protein kinase [Streptosporangium sp. NPDC049304]|uniref:protein kinase domain-containing protein n=1 Tax=Streptosporangium sp. NPDC049304 TaxID=3154830 RepID=UPI00341F5656